MDPSYEEIVTTCSNCELEHKLKDMKLNPQNNLMVCINCHNMPNAKIKRIK